MSTVRIVVNGQAREVPAGTTVASLLELMGVGPQRVAVERNQDVVPRATYASVALAEGDTLEVVGFVGGG